MTFYVESKYMNFRRVVRGDRQTPIVYVTSKSTGAPLGEIKWFGRWRQFCFYPVPGCVFNRSCLNDIIKAINELMAERNKPGPVPAP